MTNYPKTIKYTNVKRRYKTMKEAKLDGAKNIYKFDRDYFGYIPIWEVDNYSHTNRNFYVIDENGKLHFQRLEIIKSHPYDGTVKLIGFEGIFISKCSWDIDLYVSEIIHDMPLIKKFISELTKKEIIKNRYIEEQTKSSKTLINNFLALKGLNLNDIKKGNF